MKNALSVDVEDYFHVTAFESVIDEKVTFAESGWRKRSTGLREAKPAPPEGRCIRLTSMFP